MLLTDVVGKLQAGAIACGTTIDQYVKDVMDWQNRTATERSDKETREAAKSEILAMFQADPRADLDPKEVASQVGLKNCQADRMWLMHQWKRLRLTYGGNEAATAAAD